VIHPPSGIVGGDTLNIELHLQSNTHALLTTPGATRFYRSPDAQGVQKVHAQLASGARLEWLPLETIAYPGCQAINQVSFDLAPGAELMSWDIVTLGLPHAHQAFDTGRFLQHMSIEDRWLEKALIDAQDESLMNSPLGLAGYRCLGTFVLSWADAAPAPVVELALDLARACIAQQNEGTIDIIAGATSPNPNVVVVRTLSHVTEPVAVLFKQIWAQWRTQIWQLPAQAPRTWAL
jgi:urease accessory protein